MSEWIYLPKRLSHWLYDCMNAPPPSAMPRCHNAWEDLHRPSVGACSCGESCNFAYRCVLVDGKYARFGEHLLEHECRARSSAPLIPAYAPYNASKVGSFPSPSSLYGWLSKLRSLFGHPKYQVPYHNRDPKRDHNFDNHPYKA